MIHNQGLFWWFSVTNASRFTFQITVFEIISDHPSIIITKDTQSIFELIISLHVPTDVLANTFWCHPSVYNGGSLKSSSFIFKLIYT
ncbi:hypothetical protein PPL_06838 [Heterostelium album PN500]|uniref:Uncharacterized protein n=1 Tax=Heterostelium pallidum (strain ATCC 26659 / Pp 5 / PN500) TaxID=670386 RepID=D3BDN6_HETP5|nr:hypothetical protein PPL_06838 [Heterostelium album PN500]EFA80017.1 hypothetical protein PPL_06838 [Heterostelium album PN500]|eukprot:XP_020432137.1 hypothetical protein PPL_06838 [Heterostelium album PN500]